MNFLTTAAGLIGGLVGGPTGAQVGKMAGGIGGSLISSGSKTVSGGGGGGSSSGGGGASSIQTALYQSQQAQLRAQEEKRAGFIPKPRAQLESAHGTVASPSIAARVIASIAADQEGKSAIASLRNNMFQRQLSAMESPLRNI